MAEDQLAGRPRSKDRTKKEGSRTGKARAESTNASVPSRLKKAPRLEPVTAELKFVGDMVIPKVVNNENKEAFQIYQKCFEHLASLPKVDRLLNYRMLAALMLTSQARHERNREDRKKLFDYKNDLFKSILDDPEMASKVKLTLLRSERHRVLKFCEPCAERLKAENIPIYKSEGCENCEVDRNYYNVVAIYHRYDQGQSSIFMSIDHFEKLNIEVSREAKLNRRLESFVFGNTKLECKSLVGFSRESVVELAQRLGSVKK